MTKAVLYLTIAAIFLCTCLACRPAPSFQLSDLVIKPTEAMAGDLVEVSVVVTNVGAIQGEYIVKLGIDGIEKVVKEVELGPGESSPVLFTVTENLGSHVASVGSLSATFQVVQAIKHETSTEVVKTPLVTQDDKGAEETVDIVVAPGETREGKKILPVHALLPNYKASYTLCPYPPLAMLGGQMYSNVVGDFIPWWTAESAEGEYVHHANVKYAVTALSGMPDGVYELAYKYSIWIGAAPGNWPNGPPPQIPMDRLQTIDDLSKKCLDRPNSLVLPRDISMSDLDESQVGFLDFRITVKVSSQKGPEPVRMFEEPIQAIAACKRLTWEDDFSNPGNGWDVGSSQDYETKYDDGQYHILLKSAQSHRCNWNKAAGQLEDFTVEGDGRLVSKSNGAGYGLIFHLKDEKNFYYFLVTGNGCYIVGAMLDGYWLPMYGGRPASVKGGNETNYFELTCSGSKIRVAVNGNNLTTLTDNTLSKGYIGVIAYSNEPETQIVFDNIKVYGCD